MNDREYEAWRPSLIAFYRKDGPWFQKIWNLEHGFPLTDEDKRVIDGLVAAFEQMRAVA